jgi:hypothetical protein
MDFSSVMTFAQFAEKIGTTVGNVKNWADKADVKPVHKFGNTNVYNVADLEAAVGKFASTASALRAVGYVHPDQYKDMQDLHASAVREAIELQSENDKLANELEKLEDAADHLNGEYVSLLANFNSLQAEYNTLKLAAIEADLIGEDS